MQEYSQFVMQLNGGKYRLVDCNYEGGELKSGIIRTFVLNTMKYLCVNDFDTLVYMK